MENYAIDSAAASDVMVTAAPVPIPVPNLPTLYALPSDLHAVYRPVPRSLQASIWLVAVLVAALTTRNVKALVTRLVTASLKQVVWQRKFLGLVVKTIAIGLLSTVAIQDMCYGPSRVTVPQLIKQYWLPSTLSKYQVLNIPTTNSTHATPVGVHYLLQVNPKQQSTTSSDKDSISLVDAVYLNHGFGASALSWLPSMEPLATTLGARFVAGHDATGFGFTERPSNDLELFSYRGSSKIGMTVWNQIVQQQQLQQLVEAAAQNTTALSSVVLMGHSMGSLATLHMALAMDPAMEKHVILISPALNQPRSNAGSVMARIPGLGFVLNTVGAYVLRRLVGVPGAWRKGLELAWGDPKRLLDSDVLRYQWPSIGKGWELGLLAFSQAQGGTQEMTDKELLERVLQLPNTTLSVILASEDRVVPPNKTRKFLKQFPSVHIETLDGLGHDPFEEDAPVFVATVEHILQKQCTVTTTDA